MATKRRSRTKKTTGPRGPRGTTGPAGPPGASGHNHTNEIARLSAQLADIIRELQTQLTRIAQIQAQLDHLALGQAPPAPRPARTDN